MYSVTCLEFYGLRLVLGRVDSASGSGVVATTKLTIFFILVSAIKNRFNYITMKFTYYVVYLNNYDTRLILFLLNNTSLVWVGCGGEVVGRDKSSGPTITHGKRILTVSHNIKPQHEISERRHLEICRYLQKCANLSSLKTQLMQNKETNAFPYISSGSDKVRPEPLHS